MSEKEKIIDKVRKLLALSTSSNEHEAALAASHAQRLLAEHNLAMSDLEVKEAGADASDLDLKRKTVDKWLRSLFGSVAAAFDCSAISISNSTTTRLRFIGCGEDPQVAMYTMQYLVKEIERLAKQFVKGLPPHTNKAMHRKSFLLGAVNGVRAQLAQQKKATPTTSTALVPVKQHLIKQFVAENHGEARTVKTRRSSVYSDSYAKGKAAGAELSIRKGVTGQGDGQAAIG